MVTIFSYDVDISGRTPWKLAELTVNIREFCCNSYISAFWTFSYCSNQFIVEKLTEMFFIVIVAIVNL